MMLVIGATAGWLAHFTPMPLPYMLASLLVTGIIVAFLPNTLPDNYDFPQGLRSAFIAIIGLTIGGNVTLELIDNLSEMVYSLIAVSFFVLLVHMINYLIFRRLGKMDRRSAFFAGAPGGLIESVTMGEAANADTQQIIMQQFLRIIFVVALVPIAISLWVGHPVGSADGTTDLKTDNALTVSGIVVLFTVSLGGFVAGRLLRLPAGELTGPLIGAAVLNIVNFGAPEVPTFLLNISQIVIGVSLGMRFKGFSHRVLLRGFWLSAISVALMLAIGGLLAFLISPVTNQPLNVLIITFAPGGVTEMGLVALSLQANPAFVTLHHIFRITLTVLLLGFGAKRLINDDFKP
jgi:membrane AbrB-like protein